jgi:hypothetical protein
MASDIPGLPHPGNDTSERTMAELGMPMEREMADLQATARSGAVTDASVRQPGLLPLLTCQVASAAKA